MSDKSAIEWTDATWNPTTGCTKVSPGCAHCYIERTPAFRIAGNRFVDGKTDIRIFHDRLEQPLHWRKPRRVFVNSLSDLFHEDISDAFISRVFEVMAQARRHTFQVLTKRADRMRAVVSSLAAGHTARDGSGWPLPNVWLGVSVENQHFADERIPLLLQTPAAVRFISAEPLLGPVDLTEVRTADWMMNALTGEEHYAGSFRRGIYPKLDWVIPGFESGARARPGEVAWVRSLVQQCAAAGVACFVKQLGAKPIDRNDAGFEGDTPTSWPMDTDVEDSPNGYREEYQGAPVRIRLHKKGGDPQEWPEDLRVRQFPASGEPAPTRAAGGRR